MNKKGTIAVTGAAGFIGSCLVAHLNQLGYNRLVLVDDFSRKGKALNLKDALFSYKVHRDQFEDWWKMHPEAIDYVFHIGARTDTTEADYEILKTLNLDYSKWIWEYCAQKKIPLVYASSAATYGNGELGYKDDEKIIRKLKPLNPYGVSKNEFDHWALEQKHKPPFWAGMKFFNVYGPNEFHKGRMASVIFHTFLQIQKNGAMKLFRSHNPDYKDGEQLRDFVYVKDVLNVLVWMMEQQPKSGIYNLGTGQARTFKDLAAAVFKTLQLPKHIEYIDTPPDIRDKYQYFTEADMAKLKKAGYPAAFFSLENGVADYVKNYLLTGKHF
jgi:ADP-L-glycero-D-manno-heptose 6-epimerase